MNNTKYSREDLTGKEFGWWKVLRKTGSDRSGVLYLCRCKCGIEKPVSASVLHRKTSKSCGCRRKVRIDLTGQVLGNLTVRERIVRPDGFKGRNNDYWRCECICGNYVQATTGSLNFRSKNPNLSCGCMRRNRYCLGKHKYTPEYRLWDNARLRAKKRGIAFDITPEDVKIPDICPLLGIRLESKEKGWDGNTPSLDRKFPSSGYTKDNVWVISFRANLLKNDASKEELERLVEGMKKYGI